MERIIIINAKNGQIFTKVFKAVVNELLESLPIMEESGSEVYYLITEPRTFEEGTRLPA